MKPTAVVAACVILAGVASVAWLARHASGPDAERLEFYPEGRLKSRTTAKGDKIRYEYGQSGRLAKVMYSPWSSIDFRYNGADDMVAMRDRFGTSRFERDPFGRLGKYVSSNGQELAYEYDPWGRVISVSVSGGSQVRYGHDIFGHLTSVNDGHGLTTYEYREREVVRRLPNGVKTIYSFSADRHLTSIVHRKANDSLLCSFGYVFRADGKLLETNEETSAGRTTERYEYDLLGRLANVQRSDGSRIFYAYDSMGNRVSETSDGHTTSYEYDAHGRLARKGSEVYQYDNAGNLLSKRDQARGRSGEYEYDADNNLVKVRGPKTVRYAYDGLGHRIKREGGGNTDYYLNDLSHGLAQTAAVFDGSGNLRVQYILADSRIAARDGNGRTLYYLADRMGSVRYIVDEQAEVVREQRYSPFGGLKEPREEKEGEVFGFDGEVWDQDAGLLYLRRRYYDPAVGRFLSKDPFRGDPANPRSLNRYVFASNDPINRRDPSGFQDDGGGGFSFDAPVFDTGSSYSGSQSFADNWSTPGSLQFQTADPAGPSFMDTVKNAASNLLTPGMSLLNATSNGSAWAPQNAPDILFGPPKALAQSYSEDPIGTGFSILKREVQVGSLLTGTPWITDLGAAAEYPLGELAAGAAETAATKTMAKLFGAASAGIAAGGYVNDPSDLNFWKAAASSASAFTPEDSLLKAPLGVANQTLGYGGSLFEQMTSSSTARSGDSFFGPLQSSASIMDPSQFGIPGGDAPIGGVRLDRAAELIGSIGKISGAVYDVKSGRLILVGDKNTVLPPMRLDDIAVALRAAYSRDPAEPSMTIDPDPRHPRGPTMNVIFFGGTQNTHFGWVMFEADRVMKTYSVGRDNVTNAPVQSQIEGYANLVQLNEASRNRGQKPHLWSRFWLVPETIKLRVSDDGTAILFDDARIRVKTETMRWAGGKLVSAGGERDEQAEYFARHFSEHYEEYARENSIYGELKRLAQIYALAKWMKQAGIEMGGGR